MKRFLKNLISQDSSLRLLYHRMKAEVAACMYGYPARKLVVIGITGTDGKTTTVGMLAHMLGAIGIKAGALSTAYFRIGDRIEWNPTQKTSPSPFHVQKFLRRLIREGCTHAVLECSSHGLVQGRLQHCNFRTAGITNMSPEHLDYHGTMEKYIEAKSLLFRMCVANKGSVVLNGNDISFDVLSRISGSRSLVFADAASTGQKNLFLCNIHAEPDASSATVVWKSPTGQKEASFVLKLEIPGLFNLQNALCAIGCLLALKPSDSDVHTAIRSLSSFTGVAGRMERIDCSQPFSVFIDFTVTPQSYEATFRSLKEVMKEKSSRLIALVGSCGDRMKEKRPVIGSIAARYADTVIVTNEDPYTEDPERIIDDVIAGMPKNVPVFSEQILSPLPSKACVRISDRLHAIRFVLRLAKKGDTILLCGKGSDITMMTKSGQIPWNEREIVREELTKMMKLSSVV